MAAVTRQPFAPLDGARLQNLTSLKNRQNSISPPSNGKRKAELIELDDSENVNPYLLSKRSKSSGLGCSSPLKKPAFVLTRAASAVPSPAGLFSTPRHDARSSLKPASAPRRLAAQQTLGSIKTPVARVAGGSGAIVKPAPLSAPAGRSPTRSKRSGILSTRRRGTSSITRVDPPSFNLGGAPFSLDAALKGTIAGYTGASTRPKPAPAAAAAAVSSLDEPEMKASWFFDIHEDTPEQEMTNLLQHGTCVLDISSDEESEQKARRDRDEGRDKENVPPPDDVSQTSARPRSSPSRDSSDGSMVIDGSRVALGEMKTADYYPDGCDESSIVIVPGDEDDHEQEAEQEAEVETPTPQPAVLKSNDAVEVVSLLMDTPTSPGSSKAAVLQPIEGTGESFELWESGSAKGDAES